MEQYIPKSALVEEIKERIKTYNKGYANGDDSRADALEVLLHDIDTLEVKEVDLEKYYHDFLQKEWFGNSHVRTVSEMMAFTAKHFFELGMQVSNKAQKGEKV